MRRLLVILCLWSWPALAAPERVAPDSTLTYALVQYDKPALPEGFDRLPYANPDAPKGGAIRLGEQGTFDTLNAIPLGGDTPSTLAYVYDPLMAQSADEIGTAYPLIAEAVEYPADYSWVVFHLDPRARFQDGSPITAEDVAWTFRAIGDSGNPLLQASFADIAGVDVIDAARVRFRNARPGWMKPLLAVSQLAPLPRAWWDGSAGRDIAHSTLVPPLGSGPYRVASADSGRNLVLERVRDYWAADLPMRRGLFNFDSIATEYYRDADVLFTAFAAGRIDMRVEYVSKFWATRYEGGKFASGEIARLALPDNRPSGVQAFFINTRRPQFADIRVRQALDALLDFEWIQRTQFYGSYKRLASYFPNSDYGARGLPDAAELALLEPFRASLPPELFTQAYAPPTGDGSGTSRERIRTAQKLLAAAGWTVKAGRLVDGAGTQMRVEFLYNDANWERLYGPYAAALQKVGIDATLRLVDSTQYRKRMDEFDFDVTTQRLPMVLPPGPELRSYFGSGEANRPGSKNYTGFASPAADAMLDAIVAARDGDSLRAATRALDRILLWSHPTVLQWGNDAWWLGFRDRFGRPDRQPRFDSGMPETWWLDREKDAKLAPG